MIIDVLINSCARPDVLEISIFSFMKMVKTNKHEFRYIIVEDKVKNEKRQKLGREWIKKNSLLFDKIIFLNEISGPGYWWAKTIKYCTSKFHLHLEDDNKFIKKVNIDPMIELLEKYKNFIEICFSRGNLKKDLLPKKLVKDDILLTEINTMSVASGVFNTNLVKQLISSIGWDQKMNEFLTLTPMTNKMGFRKFILGHDDKHYIHLGETLNYRKGAWKL